MHKIKYNKKFKQGKMRNKEKLKIYNTLYNWDAFTSKNLLVAILSLFSGIYLGKELIIDLFKSNLYDFLKIEKVNSYLLILVLIVTSCIYIYCFYKIYKSFSKIEASNETHGFLGIDKPYTKCFLDLSNERYIRIFNENVENRIFYSEIKKISRIKETIFIKYGKKQSLSIPISKENVQGALEILNNNKNNIEKIKDNKDNIEK